MGEVVGAELIAIGGIVYRIRTRQIGVIGVTGAPTL